MSTQEKLVQSLFLTNQKSFSFVFDQTGNILTPWKAAFPDKKSLGYSELFSKRCAKIADSSTGLVDEITAKQVWLSILDECESYQRKGMWLPSQVLDEHRMVAKALGWI